jgi:hypothetical protein
MGYFLPKISVSIVHFTGKTRAKRGSPVAIPEVPGTVGDYYVVPGTGSYSTEAARMRTNKHQLRAVQLFGYMERSNIM